jgi:hypothetical protein
MHLFPSIAILCCAGVGEEESTFRFRVVDALTGQACPGATVHFLDASPRSWQTTDPFWSIQERFERTGSSVIADESGTATLPGDVEIRAVGAVSKGRFGSVRGSFERRSSPQVIPVFPVRELLLRIVDDRDRPSPVEILVYEQNGGGWHQWQRTKADADGLARVWTLEGCPSPPAFWPTYQRFDDGQRLHLFLGMVTDGSQVAKIDTATLPTGPLPVRVPPFGELVVRVRGADGVPARGGYVYVNVVDAPRLPGVSMQPILEGVARFPAVALGLTLDLAVSGRFLSATLPGVAGPVSIGQSVTVDVELPGRRPDGRALLEVCGRARLGGQNAPLRTLHSIVLRGGSPYQPYPSRNSTDEEGDFRFESLHDWQAGDELLLSMASADDLAPIDAFARLPLPLPAGPIDLGDVELAPAPLLCAGAIIDERDLPVAAQLMLSSTEMLLPGSRLTSGPSGLFALYAFQTPDREPQISIMGPTSSVAEWSSSLFSFRPGTNDLQLECLRGWSVEGRAVVDEGIPAIGVSVQLVAARFEGNDCVFEPWDWPTCQETRLAPDGHFFAGRVVPGPHHLVFRWAEAFELHRVENLWIGADGSYDSSRTAEVDLRGTLRIVTAYGEVEGGGTLPEGDLRLSPLSSSLDPWIEGYPPVFTKLSPRPTRLVVPRGSYQLGFRNKTHVAKPVPIEGDLVRVLLRPK